MTKLIKAVLLLCSFTIFPLQAKPLAIGWELWYPYQYYNKQSKLVGLDIDVMNAVLDKANMTGEYTELPWQRHLKYIESGKFDVALGTSFSKEREDYAYFSVPYRKETVYLFVNKGAADSMKIAKLGDLANTNYTIGVEEGYFYGNEYEKLIKTKTFKARIKEIFDIEQNVQLLLNKKIDGFLADPATVRSFEEKYQLKGKFEAHKVTVYSDDIYLILSKKAVDNATFGIINKALIALKQDGTIKKLRQKWRLDY